VLYDPVLTDHLFLGLFSQQLDEAGGDGWATSLLGGFGADCEQTETVTLGSTPGVLSPACLVAVASLDNRGYLVWLHVSGDDAAAAAPYDVDWFRAIVGTVRLNPRAAWMRLPLEETYTSEMHGISIAYPAGWRTSRSDEPWTDFLPAGYGDQMYMRETDSPFIAVASQPLAGKTSEQWIADLTSWDPSCDSATEPVEIDGEPGVITIQCGAERGQVNALVNLITIYRNWDIGWFKEILETVDLRPEDATDAAS
jgi:hypothetical protein